MNESQQNHPVESLSEQIVSALREVLGDRAQALHEPRFSEEEAHLINECLRSTFVSSIGKYVDQFEQELAEFTGARQVVAVVNGTAALHTALKIIGVRAGDEVLIPALSFIATANAVSYTGALPHFADSSEQTLGLDPVALRDWLRYTGEKFPTYLRNRFTGRPIRALVPMHTFGHPVEIDDLLAVAHDFNLVLVEDAAEALGSYYKGKHTGTFGSVGIISFNGNKIITTGGGGAILTNDQELGKKAKHLTTTAKLPHRWAFEHDVIGFNYRMPNLNAALGCAQLKRINDFLVSKRRLALAYSEVFSKVPNVRLQLEPTNCQSNYWLQTIVLDEKVAQEQDAILKSTNDAGISTRPVWKLLSELEPYKACPSASLNVAKSLARRLINLPSSAGLV